MRRSKILALAFGLLLALPAAAEAAPTITSGPTGDIPPSPPYITADSTPSFTYQENTILGPVGAFRCSIGDPTPDEICDGGSYTSTALGPGTYTFYVEGIFLGRTGVTQRTFTVDTVGPDTSITGSTPASPTNATGASFTFSSSESNSTFECKLDGGSFGPCSSPKAYSGLSDGSHTFQVRATDELGNTDQTPASFTWFVDTDPPETAITSNPTNPTTSTTANFTFTFDEAATFECRLDGTGGFQPCTTPKQYTGLTPGSHTFEVRAKDLAGNLDPTPASFSWTITSSDTTPPETAIVNKPSDPTTSTSAAFTYSSSEANSTFQCKLDGEDFAPCSTAGRSYSNLSVGSHTFQVKATDAANNTDPTPDTYTWQITGVPDTTPPETSLGNKPADPTTSRDAAFTYSSSEPGSTFECRLDGDSFAPCSTAGKSYSNLALGTHTFRVRATDAAGNTDASPVEYTWEIQAADSAAPDTTITGAPAALIRNRTPSFSFAADEPGTSYRCRVDSGQFASCSSPHTTASLNDGSHTFEVAAVDSAGNQDASPAQASFKVDATAPTTRITKAPKKPGGKKGRKSAKNASFQFTADESDVTFECRIDKSGFAPCKSPHAIAGIPNGKHVFRVRGTDLVGNLGPAVKAKFFFRKKKGGTAGPPIPDPPSVDPCAVQPTITGTALPEVLTGTAGADVIHGADGDDRIDGGGGDDLICGGGGNDDLNGGPGDDLIKGISGDDQLAGGIGSDSLLADEGNDRLEGMSGNDLMYGASGSDFLVGGSGSDFLDGGLGNDQCDGGSDKDSGVGCERATPF
jgi:Ca2+-binding RTX toxin-like protein